MSTRSSGISIKRSRAGRTRTFALCLRNKGYEASLEPRKFYEAVPDVDAASHGQVRIIDESGEDYLFPASYFASVKVSPTVRKLLAQAG